MSIFYQDQKIGYAQTRKRQTPKGFTLSQDLYLELSMMGLPRQVQVMTTSHLSPQLDLKSFTFRLMSGYLVFFLRGSVEGENLQVAVENMGRTQNHTLRLKAHPQLPLTLPYRLYRAHLQEGDKVTLSLFDPATLSQTPVTITAGPFEWIDVEGAKEAGQRFQMDYLGIPAKVWVDYKGRILKEEGVMGLSLIRSSQEKAIRFPKGPMPDLVQASAVPVDRPLKDPARYRHLMIRLLGLPIAEIPRVPGRQEPQGENLRITREALDPGDTYPLPYPGRDQDRYLADHPLLGIYDGRIGEAVKGILAQETDAQKALITLNRWVYQNIQKKPTLSLPQAAAVLTHREGDCNEHATLLLALLRRAGIPARMAVGLTQVHDRFYYHAWVEAYLNKWVSADPTFGQIPADVTHLKLAQGPEGGMESILKLLGRLKLEIKEAS
jgi:hypothetical protein